MGEGSFPQDSLQVAPRREPCNRSRGLPEHCSCESCQRSQKRLQAPIQVADTALSPGIVRLLKAKHGFKCSGNASTRRSTSHFSHAPRVRIRRLTARFSASAPTFFPASVGRRPKHAPRASAHADLTTLRQEGLANIMSSEQAIGAPFTLASLPKPISSTNGRVHAAGVCSISGIKKRKRTEIVVGLNGEGVSIYSVCLPYCAFTLICSNFRKAPKPTTRNVACPAAERLPHSRPVLDIPKRLFKNTFASLYLCLCSRSSTS